MKKTYFIYLILMFGIIENLYSQSTEIEIVSLPSNVHLYSNTSKATFDVRAGSGMTIIKETFDGELWEEDAKAAVSYACRLMEEYLPTMYPIEIRMVRKQELYTNYVKTSVKLYQHNNFLYPRAAIKRNAIIKDKDMTYNDIYSMEDAVILFSPDDIFSTRLDGEVEYNKYDLVTVTLRELAKVLAMSSTVSQIKGKNELNIYKDWVDEDGNDQGKYLTPYVNALLDSDLNKTPSEFYNYFTSNNVYIKSWNNSPIKIYAPNNFDKNTSLIYFDEDPNNKETRLFQPTLPKGTAIHYIGSGLKSLFKHLGWYDIQRPTITGLPNTPQCNINTNICNATKEFIINTDGSIQNVNQSKKTANTSTQKSNIPIPEPQTITYDESTTLKNVYPYMQEDGIWAQGDYGIYNNDAIMFKTLFLLKSDGTLHIVKKCDSGLPIYVNLDTLMDKTSFARTSDGLLRFRLNDNEWRIATGENRNKVIFFNAGINPPQPKLALKKNYLKSAPSDPDSYYEEKNLAFSNMEGVTSATMIETVYDEYGPISTTTYPIDVQSGNFIATIDKELKTVYQLVSKNQFGETRSKRFTFLPKSRTINIEALINQGVLHWRFVDEFKQPIKIIAKEALLTNLTHPAINIRREISDNKIDIQNLPQGVYNLTLKDNKNNIYNSKVIKTE